LVFEGEGVQMIEKLTSELNRINQGCPTELKWESIDGSSGYSGCGEDGILCDTCQKEKETLKKVSIMWADETQNWIDKSIRELNVGNFVLEEECHKKIMGLREIKSLMEKA